MAPNPFVDRFIHQIQKATQRFDEHTEQRRDRMDAVKAVRAGRAGKLDLSRIDDPLRVARRFATLSNEATPGSFDGLEGRPASDAFFLERIIGENELQSSYFLIEGAMRCRTVGRVVIRSSGGQVLGYGTGFLVSPRLLMTNNHVLSTTSDAEPSTIQFDYVAVPGHTEIRVSEFRFQPHSFFHTDVDLDYTIVAVSASNERENDVSLRGWNPLIAPSGKLIVGEPVNIVQHPGGETQQVSLRQNRIVDLVGDFLHYTSDTRRGSSGSPVANDQWQIGALHHSGVPRKDGANILLIDGRHWDGSEQTMHLIDWRANEGARISRIVEDVVARVTDPAEQLLLNAAFEAPNPASGAGESVSHPPPHAAGSPVIRNGRAVFQVPIEISVGLPPGFSSSAATRSPTPPTPGVGRGLPKLKSPDRTQSQTSTNKLLDDALALLRQLESAQYYDEAADTDAANAYYAEIASDEDLVGRALFEALSDKLRATHTRRLSYRDARLQHLYPNVDLHPNNKLVSLYSGNSLEPEEIIRAEIAREVRLEERLRERNYVENLSPHEFQQELERLEDQLAFNCEHVVPQSWFQKRQPMKADLHHLFACEPGCNSFRSNIPYFQFGPEEEAVRMKCGRREPAGSDAAKFEPEAGKGAAARATLYFLLRYPGEIGDEARELQIDRINVLLRWHQEFDVSEYEFHRNAEIFAIQGNRNPLIDFPDWANFIDFKEAFAGGN
jgi:endonuclease I/V8-like Glu-specific endopeptidase